MDLGTKVKILRKSLGMTQNDLAKMCGYKSLTTINKIELGINSVPLNTVEKLAKALQTTPSYLMGWENDESKSAKTEPMPTLPALSEEDEAMLNTYLELSDDSKRVVRYTVNMYAKSENINIDSSEKRSV